MNKEEKIKCLKQLEQLLKEWFAIREKGGPDHWKQMSGKILKMARIWGVASEILKGLDYKLEIEIDDDSRGKNIKPKVGDLFHNGIFSCNDTRYQSTNMLALQSYVLSAIEKLNKGVIVRENVLPNVNLLTNILNNFNDAVSRLKYRRKGKDAFILNDEYDVQDVIYVMLKGAFSTLQYEDPTSKNGLTSARPDFTVKDLNTYIEAKFISKKGKEKEIQEECKLDIDNYGAQDNCYKIIFFIYDPNKCIDNQHAFKASLEKSRMIDNKEIEVITLIIN